MKAWSGCLQNRLEEGKQTQAKIEVGMGATEMMYTDRRPYTIIEVKSPCRIVVQKDNHERTDKNGMSECQDYTYSANPNGEIKELIRTKRGWKELKHEQFFLIGRREYYFDYSF